MGRAFSFCPNSTIYQNHKLMLTEFNAPQLHHEGYHWAEVVAQEASPLPAALSPHMDVGLSPGYFVSDPAPCQWSGKALEDSPSPRAAASTGETWEKLLASAVTAIWEANQ